MEFTEVNRSELVLLTVTLFETYIRRYSTSGTGNANNKSQLNCPIHVSDAHPGHFFVSVYTINTDSPNKRTFFTCRQSVCTASCCYFFYCISFSLDTGYPFDFLLLQTESQTKESERDRERAQAHKYRVAAHCCCCPLSIVYNFISYTCCFYSSMCV